MTEADRGASNAAASSGLGLKVSPRLQPSGTFASSSELIAANQEQTLRMTARLGRNDEDTPSAGVNQNPLEQRGESRCSCRKSLSYILLGFVVN